MSSDAIFGIGATRAEKGIATIIGFVGAVAVTVHAGTAGATWTWVQYLIAAVIAFDVVGGVVANGLNSAKREHFGPSRPGREPLGVRLVRRPILFTAVHVHPVIVAFVFAPQLWWWGIVWYAVVLAATIAVRVSPLYLQRPVALGSCALIAMASSVVPAPSQWVWFPVVLAMKLVLAYAVQEEPYRPATAGAQG